MCHVGMCHVVHHVVILARVMLILEDPTTGTSDPTGTVKRSKAIKVLIINLICA